MSLSQFHTWRALQLRAIGGEERHELDMNVFQDWLVDLSVPAIILLHLVVSPYTKVEESFNIQATHDILECGVPLRNSSATIAKNFDHSDFPGSVPRTFVGDLILASTSTPFVAALRNGFLIQIVVRWILGVANSLAITSMRRAVDTAYGKAAGRWYIFMQVSQFHVMYYASRTLPNMFAFILTTVAQRHLILSKSIASRTQRSARRRRLAIVLLTIAGVVFRSEIALLLMAEVLQMILRHRVSLIQELIPAGLIGVSVGLLFTVSVDSFFWQRFPLWPELAGFYYNTILGKSSDWGTSPFNYYFLNALPRLLLNPLIYLVCIPAALASKSGQQTSQDILVPHLAFISIYSLLPHKEWRFIIYSVPAFTAVASSAAGWFWIRRSKSVLYKSLSILMILSTALSFVASLGVLYISSLNYPGGEALMRLQARHEEISSLVNQVQPLRKVYMGNLACQTGVTRFLEMQSAWIYDKTEDKTTLQDPAFWQEVDYALVEDPRDVIGDWQLLEAVKGYSGLTLIPQSEDDLLPLLDVYAVILGRSKMVYVVIARLLRDNLTRGYWPAVRMEPKIFILQNGARLPRYSSTP